LLVEGEDTILFKKSDLQELIETVSQSPIQTFKYSDGTTNIVIKKAPPSGTKKNQIRTTTETLSETEETAGWASMAEDSAEPLQTDLLQITAPMVGTYYSAAEQGGAPLVQVGDKVSAESVVCVLEAMKLFTEVKARVSGEIVKIFAEEGSLVDYGQTLFLVKPE
jgi:acetyl-CoA carboxylase biotin carboxyl carrier protein